MELVKIRDTQDFSDHLSMSQESRISFEKKITEEFINKKKWYLNGFCDACERDTKFLGDWNYSNGVTPNFRERLICQFCGLNNRQRFMVRLLTQLVNEGKSTKDIYLYEQVTDFYLFIKKRFPEMNVIGSEYLGTEKKGGEIINGIRHEDALNLSFADESFDIIISNEVFEHVPNIHFALSESKRILKNGGRLLISIPFSYQEKSIQRAVIENGMLKYLLPAEFHGNPLSETGSLVFYDFGWDFIGFCRSNGFKDAYMLGYYSYAHGYIGNGFQFMFVAEK